MTQTATEIREKLSNLKLQGFDGGKTRLTGPIVPTGAFEAKFAHIDYFDITPVIGREYGKGLQLADLLTASEEELRDFAAIVSGRGVLVLRDQRIDAEELQTFIKRFHAAAGAPASSGLHIHPNVVNKSENGDNIQRISSEAQKKAGGDFWRNDKKFLASRGWHSDISFEPVPSDYSILKIVELPSVGGDTLFASGEELYNRLSPSFQAYLETLETVHAGTTFIEEAARNGTPNHPGPRGSPLNVGTHLASVHPLVRTNPVTGKKAIFVNRGFTKSIVGLTPHESDLLLDFLFKLLVHNHDLQVRVRWNKNDLTIWDNRSNYHTATFDFNEPRAGDRACSLGEKRKPNAIITRRQAVKLLPQPSLIQITARDDAAIHIHKIGTARGAPVVKWTMRIDIHVCESREKRSPQSFGGGGRRRRICMPSISSIKSKLRLEVVDVSSTAVSLSIFATQEASLGANGIEIKLNNQPWPNVVISDPAFYQEGSELTAENGATLVIYGLEAGKSYELELNVVHQSTATSSSAGTALPSPTREEERATAFSREEPPPPYQEREPIASSSNVASTSSSSSSSDSKTARQREVELKATLKKVITTSKDAEAAIQGPLTSLKRQMEKSHKEDLRMRQKISTLEEATRKIRGAIEEETQVIESLRLQVDPLQDEADSLSSLLEEQKTKWQIADMRAKESIEQDELALKLLKERLEELISQEDGLQHEKSRYEAEVLPDLKIRLAVLDAELKKLEEDPNLVLANGGPYLYQTVSADQQGGRSRSSSFRIKPTKKNFPLQAQQQFLESYFAMPGHQQLPPNATNYPYLMPKNTSTPSLLSQSTAPELTPSHQDFQSGRSRRSSDVHNAKTAKKNSDPPKDKEKEAGKPSQRIIPGLPSFKQTLSREPKEPQSAPAPQSTTASTQEAAPKFLATLRRRSNSLINSSPRLGSILNDSSGPSVIEEEKSAPSVRDGKMSWSKVVGKKTQQQPQAMTTAVDSGS